MVRAAHHAAAARRLLLDCDERFGLLASLEVIHVFEISTANTQAFQASLAPISLLLYHKLILRFNTVNCHDFPS